MNNVLTDRLSNTGLHEFSPGRVLRIAAFILFTAVSGQLAVYLPFTPVPLTMQTLFVVLAGIVLGPRDGFYAMSAYLAIGFAGIPVFAGFGFGPAVLLGPTGGFLAAFPAGALAAGYLRSALKSGAAGTALSAAAGVAVILLTGAVSLALVTGMSAGRTLSLAVLPFVPGEIIKTGLACVIIRSGSSFRRTGK
jgi:biotin transport system substrate-specific component